MESDSLSSGIALALSLAGFAVVAIGEASISSVRRDRVQRLVSDGVRGSAALERVHSLPMGPVGALTLVRAFFFSAALISSAALVIAQMGVEWLAIALVPLGVLLFLGAVYSVAVTLASASGEQIAVKIAAQVRALAWVLNPVLSTQVLLAKGTVGAANGEAESGPEMVSTEISLPLDSAGEPLDEREVRMIHGVVRLDKTTAREIMVPRVDMVAAEIGTPIAEMAEQMVTGGHSRVPVYKEDLDHIEGVAYARDVLRHLVQNKDTSAMLVESLIRPALFTPEYKTLEGLLNEFQQKRVHMAIVVDEYGGVSGLVTIEDLLEEIVGEIQDEFDLGEPEIETVGDSEFMIDARVGIDQLNELLNVSVEADGFDTLGGFVYHRLGKIPSPGDAVEYDGLRIEVVSTVGRRIKRLRVTRSKD